VKPPVVVRILTRLGNGGPPLHATTVNRGLAARGWDSVLVTGACDRSEGEMSYLVGAEDNVHYICDMGRNVSLWHDAKALFRLISLLREIRPAIVHTHTAKAGLLGRVAGRLAGVPILVHTFHGNVLSGYFSAPVSYLVRLLERLLARFSDAICVLSRQQKNEIVYRFRVASEDKVHVVPLGMDLAPYRVPHCMDSGLVVGWLGRLVAVKDIPLLASVIRTTLERNHRIRFILAGDGPERALVEELSQQWGPDRVAFLGWTRDVAGVIARCHVLLLTSKNEGTPVSLIQGMAAGRPFVSTAAGGVVDLTTGACMNRNGSARWYRNGVVCEPYPNAFSEVFDRLAADSDLLLRMGDAAALYSRETFSETRLLNSLEALYRKLLVNKLGIEYIAEPPGSGAIRKVLPTVCR
jgi:glycosyltransferase involved in cell wall biosynthesis